MFNPNTANFNPMHPRMDPMNASQFVKFTKPKDSLYTQGVVRKFAYVYDEAMNNHKCEYDPTQSDVPERTKLIRDRLQADGLLTDAVKVEARPATDDELALVHTKDFIKQITALSTPDQCEKFCKDKELLWLSPGSEKAARLAVGGVLELVKANHEQKIGNAFAIVRPQGHAAWGDQPQANCIYNNVAIAARYAVQKLGMEKVVVLDLDVHAPVGTYNALRDTVQGSKSKIVLFSVHSYYHGLFWPFTQDYDCDPKDGNVMFFPLNAPLNSEGEYMAIMNHAILPVLREIKPQMILLSAGFDSGYADAMFEGGQALRAHGWGHISRDLHEICPDRVIAVLEGGIIPANITESASMLVKGLQGKPTPRVIHPERLNGCLVESIFSSLLNCRERWRCCTRQLEKLQQQQGKYGFPEFAVPSQRLFLAHGIRDMLDDVKAANLSLTRLFSEPVDAKMMKMGEMAVESYRRAYLDKENELVPEAFLIEQMLYDEKAKADSYLKAAGIVNVLYQSFADFKSGKQNRFLFCDRSTLLAKRNLHKYLEITRI
ncbi:unnamed protein product, partial [Mesorhabditis spiculigera]